MLLSFHSDLDQKAIEKLCFRFAGAVLIPKETFLAELGQNRSRISLPELIAIKENYGMIYSIVFLLVSFSVLSPHLP